MENATPACSTIGGVASPKKPPTEARLNERRRIKRLKKKQTAQEKNDIWKLEQDLFASAIAGESEAVEEPADNFRYVGAGSEEKDGGDLLDGAGVVHAPGGVWPHFPVRGGATDEADPVVVPEVA
ncbi:unnamed protein product [Prorocentrum cordatum]|uniref:Ribosome biogenesis protein NOP53 n=1 Tax=Prorocentrum cordatum TaxID=2364126 RepID=A0ABN9SPI3_9DINO|nr:unnamed protein product [Polarella glacialis]